MTNRDMLQPKRCGTTVEDAAVYNSPSCLLIDNDGPADRRGEPYPDGLVYCSFGVGVREATNRVYASGEEIPLDIMLSHYDEDLEIGGGVLTWRFVAPDGAMLVAGEKPNELKAFQRLLNNIYNTKISYMNIVVEKY